MGKARRRPHAAPREGEARRSEELPRELRFHPLRLRFSIGARVQCRIRSCWTLGRVVQADVDIRAVGWHAYIVELDDGAIVLVSHDSESAVRAAPLLAGVSAWLLAMIASLVDLLFPTKAQWEARRGSAEGKPAETPDPEQRGPRSTEEPGDTDPVMTDPFEMLGMPSKGEGVDVEAVNAAYKTLALKWHPDKNHGSEESVAMMQRLNSAKAACLDKLNPEVDGPACSDEDEEADEGEKGSSQAEEAAFREFQKKRNAERKRVRREMQKAQKKAAAAGRREMEMQAAREKLQRPHTLSTAQKKKASKLIADAEGAAGDRVGEAVGGAAEEALRRVEMDVCSHPVACAVRAKAHQVLGELLTFELSPLAPVDTQRNTALHYAAYCGDLAAVNMIVQLCSKMWWKAVLQQNSVAETPVQLILSCGGVPETVFARLQELHEMAEECEQRERARVEEETIAARRTFAPLSAVAHTPKTKISLTVLSFLLCHHIFSLIPGVKWLFAIFGALASASVVARVYDVAIKYIT